MFEMPKLTVLPIEKVAVRGESTFVPGTGDNGETPLPDDLW